MPREPPVTSATRPLSENRSLNMRSSIVLPLVLSGGTVRVKEGLFPSPLVGEGGSNERSSFETGEGFFPRRQTPHPPSLREGTFSHKGRREVRASAKSPT